MGESSKGTHGIRAMCPMALGLIRHILMCLLYKTTQHIHPSFFSQIINTTHTHIMLERETEGLKKKGAIRLLPPPTRAELRRSLYHSHNLIIPNPTLLLLKTGERERSRERKRRKRE